MSKVYKLFFVRYFGLYDENNELLLKVMADLYHCDCFKWEELKKRGWRVYTF